MDAPNEAVAQSKETPTTIHRADYRPPDFQVSEAALNFDIRDGKTTVESRLSLHRTGEGDDPLRLHGEGLDLVTIKLDGRELPPGAYELTETDLLIRDVPDEFNLETTVRIRPEDNTALTGLYKSGGNYCTQCEAEGFRRITFFPDRPDVMAAYRVRIEADRQAYPVLLSNGNLIDEGSAGDGRHWALWHDPFLKPSYLFALVAGDLALAEDHFTTASGRRVRLCLWAAPADLDKCGHAMAALKKAMAWDEQVYGLEYDLDTYNIVAVSDFNMGAMENKSLNIFNTKYVLARPDTATDADYAAIEGVMAHEYFHNWTGNRVTCRDWFQLSLKEGLTVFRDQEFSADIGSRALKRIEDVRLLRAHQFAEDAGPIAHPVRPDSYIEINNFYTMTVYNKGAEVIRMMATLIGREKFRAGMDLYFQRHDGQAVTCDAFVSAMQDASGVDLSQFKLWYAQAGTPVLHISSDYDEAAGRLRLTVRQELPSTPGQPEKAPMHIPLAVGLIGPNGGEIAIEGAHGDGVLSVTEPEQTFTFEDLGARPVVSLLRGFSAPVKVESDQTPADLAFLLAHDSDAFARWEAGQRLFGSAILALAEDSRADRKLELDPLAGGAVSSLLAGMDGDPALLAEVLTLPSEAYLAQAMDVVDPENLFAARQFLKRELAQANSGAWREAYDANLTPGPYSPAGVDRAKRRLKNVALGYLVAGGRDEDFALAWQQFETAENMTDSLAALTVLAHSPSELGDAALAAFRERWRDEALVIDKWFAIQAMSPREDTLDRVHGLARHPDFALTNPNRARALINAFSAHNQVRFHDASGGGYDFLTDMVIEVDAKNPQLAARLMTPLAQWRRFDAVRQELMTGALGRILAKQGLSRDSYEIATKSLNEEG